MEYQEHLLKNVFKGDKESFEKAWQQALNDGCEEAISWEKLTAAASPSDTPLDFTLIHKPQTMAYDVKQVSFLASAPFFIWNA